MWIYSDFSVIQTILTIDPLAPTNEMVSSQHPLHLRYGRFSFLAPAGVVRLFVCARAALDRRMRLGEERNIGV
jgi:hypothetical protein